MSVHHYKTLAKWVKELGLVIVASLVVQKIFAGAPLGDPVVIFGGAVALVAYIWAIYLLHKS